MAKGGQNAKSEAQLKQEGTYRKDRHAARLKVPLLDSIPPPPPYFTKQQTELWNKICAWMKRDNILSDTYTELIERYCNAWKTWDKARQDVDKNGVVFSTKSSQIKQNPAVAIEKEMLSLMLRILQEFGYTPRASNSVKVQADENAEKDILNFLNDN